MRLNPNGERLRTDFLKDPDRRAVGEKHNVALLNDQRYVFVGACTQVGGDAGRDDQLSGYEWLAWRQGALTPLVATQRASDAR